MFFKKSKRIKELEKENEELRRLIIRIESDFNGRASKNSKGEINLNDSDGI